MILSRLNNELNTISDLINHSQEQFKESIDNQWDHLPQAINHLQSDLNDISIQEESLSIIFLKKKFHHSLQKIYDEALILLQIKSKSFELIDIILARYTGLSFLLCFFTSLLDIFH